MQTFSLCVSNSGLWNRNCSNFIFRNPSDLVPFKGQIVTQWFRVQFCKPVMGSEYHFWSVKPLDLVLTLRHPPVCSWLPTLFTECYWRREWQSTLLFSPGESHGGRSLAVVHGVTKIQTQVSNSHTHTHTHTHTYIGSLILYFMIIASYCSKLCWVFSLGGWVSFLWLPW